MKILFIITSRGSAVGGHYWSFRSIVDILKDREDCIIVNIGENRSPALDSSSVKTYEVPYNGLFSIISTFRHIYHICKTEKPDALNAFDLVSLFFARLVSLIAGIPVVHTRCGGPNPRGFFFPYCHTMIVFSKENEQHFKNQKKFGLREIHHIAQRVNEVHQDRGRIEEIRTLMGPDSLLILRIARISSMHYHSISQGIELVRQLRKDGHNVKYVLVGDVADDTTLKKIEEEIDGLGKIFSEYEFTSKGSSIIDSADFVVGTGRSLMEAAARGKVLLTPAKDTPFPVLLTEKNFRYFADVNFSGRYAFNFIDSEKNYEDIVEILHDPEKREHYQLFAKNIYDREFSLRRGATKYYRIFSQLTYVKNFKIFNLLVHLVRVVKYG